MCKLKISAYLYVTYLWCDLWPVLTAKTGDTTRSQGHGGFFLSVTGFFEASRDPLEGGRARARAPGL